MKEFFMKFFVKGVMVILAVVAVWVLYFVINFIDPTLFNFLRSNNSKTIIATSTIELKPSLGYRIYNTLFKSRATEPKDSSSSASSTPKRSFWDASSTVVWGGKNSNVWGSGQNTSQNALEGMTFVYPNTNSSPIKGMKINTLLVNENSFNYFPSGAIISGTVYSGFLDDYYFNADIYDANGAFLFSIPITLNNNFNTESFSNFYGQYNKNLNFSNYKGKAYMVIKSNNQSVSGSVLIKIELK